MIFVVIMPAWIWVPCLIAIWIALAYKAVRCIGLKNPIMNGLMAILALQTIVASSTAIATSHDPISSFACLTGIFGIFVSPIVTLLEVIALVFLFRSWPRKSGPRKSDGRKRGFSSWLSLWFALNLAVFLAHMRSALMCTV